MLHIPPLGYNHPDDGAEGDSGPWTGELGPSLPSDTGEVADARISSSCSDAPEERVPDPYDKEKLREYVHLFSQRRQLIVRWGELDLEPQRELYKRLLPYRIRAHELLSKGECKATLPDGLLNFIERAAVSVQDLRFNVDRYFLYLDEQEGGTIEWSFDNESKFEDDGLYHRLVLKNYLPSEGMVYWNWKLYRSLYTTYEMDNDYVKFVDEMSSELQWTKLYFGYPDTSDAWDDMHCRGVLQALKIAKKYTHMNSVLANVAFEEYIWRSQFDYLYREDKDALFFEIRKRVIEGQLTFEAALGKLLEDNFKTRHENWILHALEKDGWCGLEEEYNSCVKGFPGDASEDEAKDLIRAAVWKFHELKKPLHKYMERKMEIARSIGLVKCPN